MRKCPLILPIRNHQDSLQTRELKKLSWRKVLQNYIERPRLTRQVNDVHVWAIDSVLEEFLHLRDCIIELLACPASWGAEAVERLFSLCGLKTSNRRNRTQPETLEKMVEILF